MEAQEQGKTRYCEKCFAVVPNDMEFCPECGVPMPAEEYLEGSDAVIYPELARANLLRMRGEYQQAESVCLSILKRHPYNATANILLGDINVERDDLEQAIKWYEMALDLSPDSAATRTKLEVLNQRLAKRESVAGSELLGVPRRQNQVWYAVALLSFVVIVATVSFFLGRRYLTSTDESGASVVQVPVKINEAPPDPVKPVATGPSVSSAEDRQALESLMSSPELARRIVGLTTDPRQGRAIVTVTAATGENPRSVAANTALEAYPLLTGSVQLTVRVVQENRLVLVADANRTMVDQVRNANTGDEDWSETILENVWPNTHAEPQQIPLHEPEGTVSGP